MQITKTYSITSWSEYAEAPIGDITQLKTVGPILTVMGGHPCKVTTHLNDDGNGFEVREFSVDPH